MDEDQDEHEGTIATIPHVPEAIEKAIAEGDLSKLTADERLMYYREKCRSLGLNPLTSPFQYMMLNGKLQLYAKKDCAEQLRKMHGISLRVDEPKFERDLVIVHVRARDAHGREDEDYGYAVINQLKGDALGNAILKAITKGKRRTTLSICGLGDLDETEVESIASGPPMPHPVTAHPIDHTDDTDARAALMNAIMVALRGVDDKSTRVQLMHEAFGCGWSGLKAQAVSQLQDGYARLQAALAPAAEATQPEADTHHDPAHDEGDGQKSSASVEARPDDGRYASPAQIARLKALAKRVGEDAVADVQDMLEHHPDGLTVAIYDIVMARLKARPQAQEARQ